MLLTTTYTHPDASLFNNPMTRTKPHKLTLHHHTHISHQNTPLIITEREKYLVAHIAREKLLHESSFKDHDLRRLVGHANLVDAYLADHPYPHSSLYESHDESLSAFVTSGDEKKGPYELSHVESVDVDVEVRDEIEKEVYVNSCVVEVQAGVPAFGGGVDVGPTVDVRVEEMEVSEDDD